MFRRFFILPGLTLFLLTACKTNKPASPDMKINSYNLALLAWNEDTVHSYRFALTKTGEFYYTISGNDSFKTKENYQGTILSTSSADTLFLSYHKNLKPQGAKHYLIREASGTYFIQTFDSSSKRVFLRKQRSGHWF